MAAPEALEERRVAADDAPADRAYASAPVAILAPAGRDGVVTDTVLARAGFSPLVCRDMAALCAALKEDVGVVLVAEEALAPSARAALLAALDAQPSWSDVPLVVLTREGELSRALSSALHAVTARANVTLLERPVRVATLVTALRSALRARRRQFDVRDHLMERRAAEAALRAAREQADQANRAKGEFLAVMSHELRTPLNAIGGYAELMQLGIRGPITDEQREDLARIQRSQRHLLGLVNEVLNYAKLETGRVRFDVADVPVCEALTSAEGLVAPQARARGLTLAVHDCGPALMVRADPEKLRQILVNLLSNAVKFTDAGGRVEVTCEAAGDSVRILVGDTGIGIPPDKLDDIFEPFVQVRADLTRTADGTGLGLAISRDLARGMDGELTAASRPDVGSTFTLTLPRA